MTLVSEDMVKTLLDSLVECTTKTTKNCCWLEPFYDIETKYLYLLCFVCHLIEKIDFEKVNVILWVSDCPNIENTIEGPWKTKLYQKNEGMMLKKLRNVAEKLNLPGDNVLFICSRDDCIQSKISHFIGHLYNHFNDVDFFSLLWFECTDVLIDDALDIFNSPRMV